MPDRANALNFGERMMRIARGVVSCRYLRTLCCWRRRLPSRLLTANRRSQWKRRSLCRCGVTPQAGSAWFTCLAEA